MPSKAADFWGWFATAQERLRNLEGPKTQARLGELRAQLHAYRSGLHVEVGRPRAGVSELVISADGKLESFGAVQELVAAAPSIPDWRVVAFRPPRGFGFRTEHEGVTIDPARCWFLPLVSRTDAERLGLLLAVPGFDPSKAPLFEAAARATLEAGLGELRATRDLQHLELCEVPLDPQADDFIELSELAQYLTWRRGR